MPDAFTAYYNFTLPEVNGSRDTWGAKDNANWTALDTILNTLNTGKLSRSGGAVTGVVTFDPASAPTMGGSPLATQAWVAAKILSALPIGVIMMWNGSVASIPAGWQLCDGTNGTPNLLDKFILGAGPSGQANPPGTTGGAHTMSAATTNSVSAGTPSGYMDTQGGHYHGGATAYHTLTIAEMPSHYHYYYAPSGSSGSNAQSGAPHSSVWTTTASEGGGAGHYHGIAWDGAHIHNWYGYGMAGHAHSVNSFDNRPAFYAACFIMKVAAV